MELIGIEPQGWRRGRGYSHAIRAGGRLHVAGVLPWNPATQQVEETDFGAQWARALRNLREVVEAGGATLDGVVALRVYVTSLDAYRAAGAALAEGWGATFGAHFPAITLVRVAGLVEDAALVEIEAEAVVGGE